MSTERVMLLIDADNVSIDVMEQAVKLLLNQHGALHVRRAYCTAESAVKHQAIFKRLSIKPMVNLAAGKNSTDIAMAVDAIDLVLAERPDVVVICSSDSDFAPLVARLREKGCVVRGIGQKGKTGDETQHAYDDFTVLEHHAANGAAAPARRAARSPRSARASTEKAPAAKKAAAKKVPAKKAAVKAAAPAAIPVADGAAPKPAAKKAPARKTPARKRAAAAPAALADEVFAVVEAPPAPPPPAAPPPVPRERERGREREQERERDGGDGRRPGATLAAVLDCLPELAAGQGMALNVAVQRLREAHLLGKNSSSLKLFSQLSDLFELLPADKPSQVRWRGR